MHLGILYSSYEQYETMNQAFFMKHYSLLKHTLYNIKLYNI